MATTKAGRVKTHANNAAGAINAITRPNSARMHATKPNRSIEAEVTGAGEGGGVGSALDMAEGYWSRPLLNSVRNAPLLRAPTLAAGETVAVLGQLPNRLNGSEPRAEFICLPLSGLRIVGFAIKPWSRASRLET
jgi:hypothetical protein